MQKPQSTGLTSTRFYVESQVQAIIADTQRRDLDNFHELLTWLQTSHRLISTIEAEIAFIAGVCAAGTGERLKAAIRGRDVKLAGVFTELVGHWKTRNDFDPTLLDGLKEVTAAYITAIQSTIAGGNPDQLRDTVIQHAGPRAVERLYEVLTVPMSGRPASRMSPERQALAKTAIAYKKQHGGNWWQVGKLIMDDLSIAGPSPERDAMIGLLRNYFAPDLSYVTDKTGLRKCLSDLVADSKKLVSE